MVKTTNQYRCYISRYPKLRVQIAIVVAITSPSNNHSRGYSFQLFSIYDWGSQEGIHDLPIILSSYPLNGIKIHIFMIFHISYPTLSPIFMVPPIFFQPKKMSEFDCFQVDKIIEAARKSSEIGFVTCALGPNGSCRMSAQKDGKMALMV